MSMQNAALLTICFIVSQVCSTQLHSKVVASACIPGNRESCAIQSMAAIEDFYLSIHARDEKGSNIKAYCTNSAMWNNERNQNCAAQLLLENVCRR